MGSKYHSDSIFSIFKLEENKIITGSEHGIFKMWKNREFQNLINEKKIENNIREAIILKSEKLIAYAGQKSFGVLDYNLNVLKRTSNEMTQNCICKGVKGKSIFTGNSRGSIMLYDY